MEWSGVEQTWPVAGATAVGPHGPPLLLLRGSASVIAPQARFSSPKPRLTRGGQEGKQGTQSSKQHPGGGGGGGRKRGEGRGTGRRRGRRTQTDSGLREEQVDARRAAAPAAATYIQTTKQITKQTTKPTAQSDPATGTQANAERPTGPATQRRLRKRSTIRPHREDASERREADTRA